MAKVVKSTLKNRVIDEEIPEWERPIEVVVLVEGKPKKRTGIATPPPPPGGWPTVKRTFKESQESFERYFVPYRDINAAADEKIGLRRVAKQIGWTVDELRYAETLSSRFRYVDRVAAMKSAEREQKRTDRVRRKAKRDDVNEVRQNDLLDKSYELGNQLMERGRQMLAFPLVRTQVKQGGKVTIFEPAGWKHSDIPSIIKTGKELMELGSEYVKPESPGAGGGTGARAESPPPSVSTSAVSGSSSSGDESPMGSQVSTPREVIDRVLVRFPSWMLEQALAKRKEIEGYVAESTYQPNLEQPVERPEGNPT